MKIGDIVMVVGSESIPDMYLGNYGVITEDYGYKLGVELAGRVGRRGALVHTATENDLKKIGERISE